MKKYLGNASLGALVALGLVLSANMAGAEQVTGWVALLDGNTNPDITPGSIAAKETDSPEVTIGSKNVDPDPAVGAGMTFGANFSETTLANDGDFIELTGSVEFSGGNPKSDQFRWGLFDGDDPAGPITATPSGWKGYHAIGNGPTASAGNLFSMDNNPGTGHPTPGANPTSTFPVNGATKLGSNAMTGVDTFRDNSGNNFTKPASTVYNFGLRIQKAKIGAHVSGFLNGTDGTDTLDISGVESVFEADLTTLSFDSVGILVNGSFGPGEVASFTSVDVSTGNVPPIIGDFDGDTDVDGADFLLWQRGLADATNLDLWETKFGTPAAAVAAAASVPEPASLAIVGFAIALLATRRRTK